MEKAIEALKEKILQKEFRYGELGVMSRKDFIQYLKNNGGTVKKEEVQAVLWNRRKFNSMNWEEQKNYEKRMNDKKTIYKAFLNVDGGTYWKVTKTEFEFFKSLNK